MREHEPTGLAEWLVPALLILLVLVFIVAVLVAYR